MTEAREQLAPSITGFGIASAYSQGACDALKMEICLRPRNQRKKKRSRCMRHADGARST